MANVPSMQELLEAGVHFGHQVRRGNPRMAEYIFGVREGVHIINLEDSEKLLKVAAEYAQKLGEEGKILLFVGTKKQAQPIIQEMASRAEAPYVISKWVGGMLTNFEEIKRNIRRLQDLEDKRKKGELSRYTKKERLLISRKLDKFEKEYGGIAHLDKLPDAIFLADSAGEKTALAESLRMEIPVIGIADSNSNPALLNYAIPGNDDATKSIKILVETIATFYEEGLRKSGKVFKEESKKQVSDEANNSQEAVNPAILEDVMAVEEEVEKKVVAESSRVE